MFTMHRAWSTNIRRLLGPAPSKPALSPVTVELGSRYHWVGQNELESNIEGERGVNDDIVSPDAPQGLQKAEAIALAWNKKSAYGTYAWIYVCAFMFGLHQSISDQAGTYSQAVNESSYQDYEKTEVIRSAVPKVLGVVLQLPAARLLNVWGRAEGFLIFTGVYLIGLLTLTACNPNNIMIWDVGITFYTVGETVVFFIFIIFITDITEMRHRALAMGFIQTAYLWNAFTSPLFENFVSSTHWRWTYWSFAIIMFVIFCPLAGIFHYYVRIAKARGVYRRPAPGGRSMAQSIKYYVQEFDLAGQIMLKAAFILLLLLFTIDDHNGKKYASPTFIIFLVVGISLLVLYGLWEKYGARNKMVDIRALKKPEIIGCFAFTIIQWISFYSWVYNFGIALGTYYSISQTPTINVLRVYSAGSDVGGVLFGITVFFTRQFKAVCIYLFLPLLILGVGLMINVRDSGRNSNFWYIVGCQALIGIASGALTIGTQLAITVYVERESIPIMLFLLEMCKTVGNNIGNIASYKIYRSIFIPTLMDALPARNKTISESIILDGGMIKYDLPVGSEIRAAIDTAWEIYLQRTYITAAAILVAAFPAVAVWKNIRLNQKQNKGVMI